MKQINDLLTLKFCLISLITAPYQIEIQLLFLNIANSHFQRLYYCPQIMPSLQKLQKTITKLKNQLLSSKDYLQLETAINLFNEVKLKYTHLQTKNNSSQEESAQNQLKRQLIETTEQLIKHKIKYFKKIALKKINTHKKHHPDDLSPEQLSIKKQHTSKRQPLNIESTLTVTNKKKLKQSLPTFFGSKQLNQLKNLEEKTLLLERTLNTSNDRPRRSPSRSEKKLKQSKSAENFFSDKAKDSFTFRKDQKSEKEVGKMRRESVQALKHSENDVYEMDDDSKTQIRVFAKRERLGSNGEEDLEYYKCRAEFLQKMMGSLGNNQSGLGGDSKHIFEQFHFKLRERALQLQQIKGRLQYYEATSQQLRARLANEQRRHEDYISTLRDHIKRQDGELFCYQKEKKVMVELIREYEAKIQQQEREKRKYFEQIEAMLAQREREKAQEQGKGENLRKELEIMARQQANIRELERLLNQQRIESSIVSQRNALLKQQLDVSSTSLNAVSDQKQTLEQLLELKLQQIESYKVELVQQKRRSSEMEEEINKMREEIGRLCKNQEEEERHKERLLRRKVEKLKEVKGLLAEGSA